jgi:hypothetical protein
MKEMKRKKSKETGLTSEQNHPGRKRELYGHDNCRLEEKKGRKKAENRQWGEKGKRGHRPNTPSGQDRERGRDFPPSSSFSSSYSSPPLPSVELNWCGRGLKELGTESYIYIYIYIYIIQVRRSKARRKDEGTEER